MKPDIERGPRHINLDTHGEVLTLEQANNEMLEFTDMDRSASPLADVLDILLKLSDRLAPVQPIDAEMKSRLSEGHSRLAMFALKFARFNSADPLLRQTTEAMIREFIEEGGDPTL